jgi:hypothetical protein
MSDSPDYQQLLSQLLDERAELDRMIQWIQRRMGKSQEEISIVFPTVRDDTPKPVHFPSLAPDTFFRMSVPQAIKTYLNIAKRPKNAQDITAALDRGGLTHKAKNLYATVYPTLLRMAEAGEVARIGKREWGLANWYPGGKKLAQEEKTQG